MQTAIALKKQLLNTRGSALIGVLVASIIIAISIAGVMTVTGSTVNHEVTALENEKAFYAAESGLLMGTRWLAGHRPWPTDSGSVATIANALNFDGMSVKIEYSVGAVGIVYILSTVTNGKLSYLKRLRWAVDSINGGGAGTVINDLSGVPDGLSGITIDGPAHFNSDILVAAGGGGNVNLFKNGLITVHSSPTRWLDPGMGAFRPGYQNDYSYGVHRKTGSFTVGDAEGIFQDRYLSGQDSLKMNYAIVNRVDLPLSDAGKTATIKFNSSGIINYSYYSGGSWNSVNYNSIGTEKGRILVAPNGSDINVYGTVNGEVSVATQGSGSIHIVGEIKYANGFSPSGFDHPNGQSPILDNSNNYGIAMTSADVVGLFSSNNISIDGSWSDAGVSKQFQTVSDQNALIAGMLYATNTMAIDDNLMANNSARNAWFMGTRSAQTFNDKFWNRGNNFNPHFLYDKRFGTGAVVPAGVRTTLIHYSPNGSDSTIGVVTSLWAEINIAQ